MQLLSSLVQGFCELAQKHKNFYLFDADNQSYTQTHQFQNLYKDRYFNLGNLETTIIPFLAGIATTNTKAIFINYSRKIISQYEYQIRKLICELPLDVHFIGIEAHQQQIYNPLLLPTTDITSALKIPHLDIYAPANETEALLISKKIIESSIPTYSQISINPLPHYPISGNSDLTPQLLTAGDQIGLISYGIYSNYAFNVAEKLEKQGIKVQLIHLPKIENHKLIEQTISQCNKSYYLIAKPENAPDAPIITIPNTYFEPTQTNDAIHDYIIRLITN